MKILIVDNDPSRHHEFGRALPNQEVTHAYGPAEAIELMKSEAFDGISLDYDLEIDESDDDVLFSGASVCLWMSANQDRCPKKVFIHTQNAEGAKIMKSIVNAIPGVKAVVQPFENTKC